MNPECGKENALLLIHSPTAKACEAPGGLARLAGALRRPAVACRVWDANLEGQLALAESSSQAVLGGQAAEGFPADPWTRRAAKHRKENLASLRAWESYSHPDRYRRAVIDLSTASAVLKNLRSTGIEIYVYLLFETPAETGEATGWTMEFIIAHSEENGAGTGRRSGGFWRGNSAPSRDRGDPPP
jgi:hypothetical protein